MGLEKLKEMTLRRETLRRLVAPELRQVAGGIVETDTPSECIACAQQA